MDQSSKGRRSRLLFRSAAAIAISVGAAAFTAHAFDASSTSFFVRQDVVPVAAMPSGTFSSGAMTATNAWKLQATNTTTGAVTLGVGNGTAASPTPGRLLVVALTGGDNVAGVSSYANHSVSDNVGGTGGWTEIGGTDSTVGNFTASISMWYEVVPSGMTQMTCNAGANVEFTTCYVEEFSGSWGTGSGIFTSGEETALGHVNTQNPIPTGTMTTATANSLLIAAEVNGAGSNPTTQTINGAGTNPGPWSIISSTYSQETDCTSWWCGAVAYDIVSSVAVNAEHTWTPGASTNQDATIIGAFHKSGAPSTYSVATSTSFDLVGVGGEAALGTSTSASYGLLGGFLRNFYKGPAPTYEQIHYHWRNDDGSETSATSATGGVQDTALSSISIGTIKRLRLEIANHGGTKLGYSAQNFGLQYGILSSTCSAITAWSNVGSSTVTTTDWSIADSANMTGGSDTTDIAAATGGVDDTNHTFLTPNGGVVDKNGTTTAAVSVSSDSFIELEYSLQANAVATNGATYCFRTVNASSTTNYKYTVYPQATVAGGSLTFTTDGGSESLPTLSPGTISATSSILRVTTSNADGFNVTVVRSDSTGTMSHSSVYIPDKTAWSPGAATSSVGNATASTTQPLTLQFRVRSAGTDAPDYASVWWGTDDTTPNALFAGFPSSAKTIINRSTAASSGTTAYVLYNVNVPATQQNGTYSGSITYTATANP